jgi:Domain of unknown function (DUF4198)
MNSPLYLRTHRRRHLLALALCLPASLALAHDTWFAPVPGSAPALLALGTGNRFPVQEFTVGMTQLHLSGCRIGDNAARPLQHAADTDTALRVHLPRHDQEPSVGISCWAQTIPFEIELPADKIALYLKEINAPRRVHDAWADLRARGLPWKERYSKHARIEMPARGAAPSTAPALASGMALDVLLDRAAVPLQVGDDLSVQVLRDGQPLPDLPLELHGDQSRLGFWKRTDAEGRVRFKLPLAGRWVLRGTDLRLSHTLDTWESRFVTLAFEVGAAKDIAGKLRTATP